MAQPAMKILVVDDEPSILKMVGKRLETEGYQVLVAMDGEEGLKKAQTENPDLVILDLMLPKLNGYEVCTLLKQNPRFGKIPIIMLSARTQEKDEKFGLECGADAYVAKPFENKDLMDRIKALVKKPGGFTLIELMLVIIIIAALAAMVVPRLAGRSEEAKISIAKADITGNVALALRLYEVDNGRYPNTEQGLQALLTKPTSPPVPKNWKGPYLEQDPIDPWGKQYLYRFPGSHPPKDYDLYSVGPDGAEGNDDIANW